LKKWEEIAQAPKLGTAYKVEKYIFKYEPLYVARAETPQFDERFIGFGMTRNTQVYEMYVAGFKFHLLNNAFTSHWGFQSLKSRPAWRAKQQEENNARFDEFAREVRMFSHIFDREVRLFSHLLCYLSFCQRGKIVLCY